MVLRRVYPELSTRTQKSNVQHAFLVTSLSPHLSLLSDTQQKEIAQFQATINLSEISIFHGLSQGFILKLYTRLDRTVYAPETKGFMERHKNTFQGNRFVPEVKSEKPWLSLLCH